MIERIVRVGQIGVGHNGSAFVRAYAATAATHLVALCDLNEERARTLAALHGVPHIYTDYREMLAREDVDLVSVHTPDHLHVARSASNPFTHMCSHGLDGKWRADGAIRVFARVDAPTERLHEAPNRPTGHCEHVSTQ